MNEIWKTIPCPEIGNKYEVSNTGFVRNAKTHKILAKKEISKYNTSIRMRTISGEVLWRPLIWLMAITFLDNPNNYTSIDYKDGNSKHINIDNLEWVCAKTDPRYKIVKDLPNEIWKQIDGYPFYQVSNLGRIKILPDDAQVANVTVYTKPKYEELCTLTPGKGGYLFISLSYKCTAKTFPVHL